MKEKYVIENIRTCISKQKLPQEIKKVIDDTYLDYGYAYRLYLSNIERAIGNNEMILEELSHIASWSKREYQEDIEITKEISEMNFESKINIMQEETTLIIRNMLKQEKNENYLVGLQPILDIEETNEYEEGDNIRNGMDFTKENKQCAEQIKESITSEIHSSKKNLIAKVTRVIPHNKDNFEYINYATRAFENEISIILNKAKMQIPTVIEYELDLLDNKIIEDVIKIYKSQHEIDKKQGEDTLEIKRKKFVDNLRENVDEEEAIRKISKEREKNKEIDLGKDLPGNVIE